MSIKVVKTVYYNCDCGGCHNGGQAEKIPDDWRYMQLTTIHNQKGVPNPPVVKSLLCPGCAAWIQKTYENNAKGETNE